MTWTSNRLNYNTLGNIVESVPEESDVPSIAAQKPRISVRT